MSVPGAETEKTEYGSELLLGEGVIQIQEELDRITEDPDSVVDIAFAIDSVGVIRAASCSVVELGFSNGPFAQSDELLIGRTIADFTDEGSLQTLQNFLYGQVRTDKKTSEPFVLQIPDSDEQLQHFFAEIKPFPNNEEKNGQTKDVFIVTATDVSALQEKVGNLHAQMQQLVESVAVTSHDLKNPVQTIMLVAEAAVGEVTGETPPDPTKTLKFLQAIQSAAESLKKIVSQNLDEVIQTRGEKIVVVSKNISDIVQSSIDNLQSTIAVQNGGDSGKSEIVISVEENLNQASPVIVTNRIDSVFLNLLDNAIKYRDSDKDRTEITIGLAKSKDGFVTVFIQDNGVGIENIDLPYIFEKNFRVRGDNEIEGRGLGLWIVKKTIEDMLGNIRVRSEVGVGTTFYVSLQTADKGGNGTVVSPVFMKTS